MANTGWSKAARRRAARKYGSGPIVPAAPEDRGEAHEAEQEAQREAQERA